jgi:hypothetical protein
MKKSLLLTMSILLVAAVAFAVGIGILSDDFSYPDGSLVGNGGWVNHSGTEGDLLVANGEVVVEHGAPSEDANVPFVPTPGSKLFYRFDFSVDDLGEPISGGDYEYFAHFKDAGFGFRARMDIVAPSGAGDYTVGISTTTSTAEATWPTDLTYGVTYTVVASYDQTNNIAELWIDPASDADPSILGVDEDNPGTDISGFALRQSDSSLNETIRVDNLFVSESFEPVATETQTWGGVKSLFR